MRTKNAWGVPAKSKISWGPLARAGIATDQMKLHHVGVAVDDLDAAIQLYMTVFGAELTHRASNEKDGLAAAFLRAGDAEVELLAPLREDTPVGKFLGALKGFKATELGAIVVREAVKRAGVNPADVDEVIMGCVIQAGLGQNPARQAALHGTRIAFVQPKSVGGVLTEFVET